MKRNLSRMFRTGVAAAAALLCAMPFQAAAEDYPSRPITLIMPFGAGNASSPASPAAAASPPRSKPSAPVPTAIPSASPRPTC